MLPRWIIPSNDVATEGAMSIEDPMTIDERRKYLRKMQERYRQEQEPGHFEVDLVHHCGRTHLATMCTPFR